MMDKIKANHEWHNTTTFRSGKSNEGEAVGVNCRQNSVAVKEKLNLNINLQTTTLYFRGERIWNAFMLDLLPKGLNHAEKALLSGCSAGGLATFLHCDKFTALLPNTATVKCLSDAGFFLDVRDVSGRNTIRPIFKRLVEFQGVEKNLDRRCTASLPDPSLCFFPQYALQYIQTPYFIVNAAYDSYQFNHILVPPSTDPRGQWSQCKRDIRECTQEQLNGLQAFRMKMLAALNPLTSSSDGGLFINTCYTHGQSELQDAWFAPDSPRLNNKTIAEAVGDWYFGRNAYKEFDCQYPCNSACVKLTNPL
ncbi:hypothetical protein H6P81_017152 [Aristolochia fimbriata]|uniref:Pectin acetylesterase n=1 Tax=Aristolochia fimbriata TaxID=158543 RepID=A0AAV7DYE4_ARIFI|nr:hypothetical protein H6P81_017152 [Aristolochia fimbriata]